MSSFPVHTRASAPEQSQPFMEAVADVYGFVPNLVGVMAASPALTEAYLTLAAIFEKKTGLTATEQQVVLLATSRHHECRYCMAAHSVIADMHKVPTEITEALRNDRPIPDTKLEALRQLVTAIVEHRGWPPAQSVQAFINAGYQPAHIFDALVGVAQKTLSNFTNHMAATPVDEQFKTRTWSPSQEDSA
jgi:AhpD family alkylhydroperoxidase